MTDLEEIKKLAKEFKEQMKNLYESVNENSSTEEIQKVRSARDIVRKYLKKSGQYFLYGSKTKLANNPFS